MLLNFLSSYIQRLEAALNSTDRASEAILQAQGRIRFEFTFRMPYRKDYLRYGQQMGIAILKSGFVDSLGYKKVRHWRL
jgi:hypothetical protein